MTDTELGPSSGELEVERDSELFISYGREPEVLAFVSKLKMDLEGNGFSVWLDMKVASFVTVQ